VEEGKVYHGFTGAKMNDFQLKLNKEFRFDT
jgi:hypothetical protein